jgi:glucokinase
VQGDQGARDVAKGAVLALDLGGTHVSAATVGLGARAVDSASRTRLVLEEHMTREQLLEWIVGAARASVRENIGGAGVAAPGPFEYETGVSRLRHKLEPLYGLDLRRELADALELEPASVRFLNDADAFLLGEWWAGAARGHERAIGVTLGTGLGSSFLDRGRIVHEGPGVPPEGALYLLSFRGQPVEERVSRRAVLDRYGRDGVDVAEIAERARGGEAHARETFHAVASDLAEFLRPWLAAFAPSCLVVGGSVAHAWDLLRPAVDPLTGDVAVVTPAANIDDAALLGAARHVFSEGAT